MTGTGNVTADVVVMGMGVAGLAAAITAHDAGARVVVLEKAPIEHAGGNARVSGQAWFSPVDVDAAQRHIRAMAGDYPASDEIISALCVESAKHNDWVSDRLAEVVDEVVWDAADPMSVEQRRVFRVPFTSAAAYAGQELPRDEFWDLDGSDCGTERNMVGGSMGYGRLWRVLTAALAKRGIEVHYGVQAVSLVRAADGTVLGVDVADETAGVRAFRAEQAVIVATGGFAANPALTSNYLRLPDATPYGSPYNTGDGMLLAQELGADLAHPYNYMSLAGIRLGDEFIGEVCEVRDNRYVLVAGDGRRFIDETLGSWHGKTRLRGGFDFYPGAPMWTIFDEDGRLAGPLSTSISEFPVGWARMIGNYQWSRDNAKEIANGWIVKADSVRELAQKLGLDADALESEIATFNDDAVAGRDDRRFGRPASRMTTVGRPPFYGYKWGQVLITTLGGIRKDAAARALDVAGRPIPQLYVAGEVASSFPWVLSGGMSLSDGLAFGRIAGRNAVMEPSPAPAATGVHS